MGALRGHVRSRPPSSRLSLAHRKLTPPFCFPIASFPLFLYFFPPRLKYVDGGVLADEDAPVKARRQTTRLWRLSIALAGLTVLHLCAQSRMLVAYTLD